MTEVEKLAYRLIKSDAKFILTINQLQNHIDNNFLVMMLPYISLFCVESEKWTNRMEKNFLKLDEKTKKYFKTIRNTHKIFDTDYDYMKEKMMLDFINDDSLFNVDNGYTKYNNIGIDIYNENYCGNTILMRTYIPDFSYVDSGEILHDAMMNVGKLIAKCLENDKCIYETNTKYNASFMNLNFYNQNNIICKPTLEKMCYFSIICSINFIIKFIDDIIIEETPQKLKYSYLLYYYLRDIIKQINEQDHKNFSVFNKHINKNFRNVIAHYGLKGVIEKEDIKDDLLGGITDKLLGISYLETKKLSMKS